MTAILQVFGTFLLWLYKICGGSYALALIVFTLLTKIILFPLSYKGKKGMMQMNTMQAEMARLQKQYGNNRVKYNEEVQKLYEREGVNPMSGCLWSFLPFPILIALYSIIRQPITRFMMLTTTAMQGVIDAVSAAGFDLAAIAMTANDGAVTVKDGLTQLQPYGQITLVKAAQELGKAYEDVNLIVCHLGGGVSVGAHQHGRVVDVCNVKDEGSMGMDRAGGLPVNQLIDYCFSGKTKDEVKRTFGRRAGMFSYLGTTDFRVVCAKVVEGDPKAVEAYQALVYQLAKDIGAMAAVLHFDVDAIVYTAGMAYEDFFCDDITAYVGKIAKVIRLPGEEEMRALAEGALRVLHGQQEAAQY